MPWWIKIRKGCASLYTVRPATLYFMYSQHSVCSAWMKSCFAKCLLWRLFEPITGSIFQDNKVTVSVPVTERERERERPRRPGRTLSACHPAQSRVDLGNETITLQLHFYTLHLHIYITPHDIMQWEYCLLQKFSRIWTPPDKTCIQISSTNQTERKNLFPKGSQINE